MDILGIAYLGFESPAYKAWIDYGPEVLGFGLAEPRDDDETVYLRMDDRRWRIAVHPGEQDDLKYIGWECRHRPAFRKAVKKLQDNGYDVEIGDAGLVDQRAVKEVAIFHDPAGYRHELCYGQKYHPNSFHPGRDHHGFEAESDGVGHIVLITPELSDELVHFFDDVMEFQWFSQGLGAEAAFYSAKLNTLSHNIGYVELPGLRGIHHIGIGCKELDDVGIAYDRVQERELQITMTLGRHTQDPVVSFYSATPSGFGIEYQTAGGRFFGPDHHEVNPEVLSVWGHKSVGPPLFATVRPVEG